MNKKINQSGFAHVQIVLLLVAIVLVSTLTVWRISKNSSQSSTRENELSQEEIADLATEAKFIDKDHDLLPLCTADITETCEDKEGDDDFDNDSVKDSVDSDDDNDGDTSDESEDDSDNDDVNDDDDSDDDNDEVEDDDDPDDDNDGEEDDEDEDEVEVEDESEDDESDDS